MPISAPNKKGLKNNPLWRFIELPLILVFVAYIVPTAKHALFPDQMTRLEKMLQRSPVVGYNLAVDRKSETKIILTVYNGGQSITTEIYRDVIRELEPSGDSRIFFAHSINDNAQGVAYLTQTRIEADADLKRVRRLEVSVCGRLANQHPGGTHYDGYKPIYECEVPEQHVVCLAAKPAATAK
jgi:hypothetical protein